MKHFFVFVTYLTEINFQHYELDRETLQLLALRLSCLAHSLHNELSRNHTDALLVSTQTMADVAYIMQAVQPLAGWLDRYLKDLNYPHNN